MSKKIYITIGIFAVNIFFSLLIYNDYRQRSLNDLINFDDGDFYSLGFLKDRELVPDNRTYKWMTEEKEPAAELITRKYQEKYEDEL